MSPLQLQAPTTGDDGTPRTGEKSPAAAPKKARGKTTGYIYYMVPDTSCGEAPETSKGKGTARSASYPWYTSEEENSEEVQTQCCKACKEVLQKLEKMQKEFEEERCNRLQMKEDICVLRNLTMRIHDRMSEVHLGEAYRSELERSGKKRPRLF